MSTVPATWEARWRPDDDELVGYLVPEPEADDASVVPVTIFGAPLSGPTDEDSAAALLDAEGMACLADQWKLSDEPGAGDEPVAVAIVEVSHERLVLRSVDFHGPLEYGTRIQLDVPVGRRMVRDGRLSGTHSAIKSS